MDVEPRGPRAPLQHRSRRTLDRILLAARDLLAEQGIHAVTVQGVVARARASVGSFYARFSGKEDLLTHLESTVWGEVREGWEGAVVSKEWSRLTLDTTVRELVILLQQTARAARRERRALRARGEGGAKELEFQRLVRGASREILLAHAGAMRHPDPGLAVDLGLQAVLGVLRDLEDVAPPEGGANEGLVRNELERLLLAYLGSGREGGEGNRDPGKGVDFFDVWG